MARPAWLLIAVIVGWGCSSGEFGVRREAAPAAQEDPGQDDPDEMLPVGQDPPPVVRIDTPVRGSFVHAASSPVIEVTGRVIEGRPTAVRVEGQPAQLMPDGGFRFVDESPAVGVRHYRVEAEDASGRIGAEGLSVLYGTLGPADERVPNALTVQVGPSVLTDVSVSVQGLIERIDLEQLAFDHNPIASGWWGTLTVEGLTRGRIRAQLVPTDAGLSIELRVADIDVDLHNDAPGPWNQDGWARADDSVLRGVVDLWADDRGRVAAGLVESSVDLEGFDFDVAGIEGEAIVRGRVEDMLRGEIETLVRDRVPPLLEDLLSSLDLTRDFDVAGGSFTLDAALEEVDVDDAGLRLRAAAAVTAAPGADTRALPGTLRTPSDAPAIGEDRLIASVADDLLNQVLGAAWSAGLLGLEQPLANPGSGEPLTLQVVTLLLPALDGLAANDAPVIVTTDPLLPPVVRFDPEGASLSMGELQVLLEAETDAGRVPLTRVALAIEADLGAQVVGGVATLALRDLRFVADPVEAPPGFPEGQPLQEILQAIVDLMVPDLEGTIASVTLPAIEGLRLTDCDVGAGGAEGDFLTLACDTAHE